MRDAGVISPRRSCRRLGNQSFKLRHSDVRCIVHLHHLLPHTSGLSLTRGSQIVEVWHCAYYERLAITDVPGRGLGRVRRGRSGPDAQPAARTLRLAARCWRSPDDGGAIDQMLRRHQDADMQGMVRRKEQIAGRPADPDDGLELRSRRESPTQPVTRCAVPAWSPCRPVHSTREHLANLRPQRIQRERLDQHIHARRKKAATHRGVLRIAGNEQHLQPRRASRANSASWRPFTWGSPTSVTSRSIRRCDCRIGNAVRASDASRC